MNECETSNRAFRDHEALRRSACDLGHLLATASHVRAPASALGALLESLEAFGRHVVRHFELEEARWAESHSSDWTSRRRIDALMREHESIRARLAAVLASLEKAREMPLAPDHATEIRAILDELLQHELSETGLFQSRVLGEFEDSDPTHLHPRRNQRE